MESGPACATATSVEKTGVQVCPVPVHVMDMGNVCARIGTLVKTSNPTYSEAALQYFGGAARARSTGIHIFAP
jgi:hypothetical protein